MAYDEAIAARIRDILSTRDDVSERHMFGGICFMVRDHMTVGLTSEDLMVRVGAEAHEKTLKLKGARPMDFTGRPMKGFVYVDSSSLGTKRTLSAWVQRGVVHAESLPPKKKKKAKPRLKAAAKRKTAKRKTTKRRTKSPKR